MKNFLLPILATLALEATASPLTTNAFNARQQKTKNLLLNAANTGAADPEGIICFPPGGRVADPPNAAPRRVVLKPDIPSIPGAGVVQKIKMRYGPYKVPNMMMKSLTGDSGALWNCGDAKIEKPCEECTIIGMVAGLEYPGGENANIDSGMWMHHMVGFTVGPGRWDPTCYGVKDSLPHFAVGSTPEASERFIASGNERTPIVLTNKPEFMNGQKVGYPFKKTDELRFIVDLMNMNMDDRVVYLTMTYDLIDGAFPAGWKELKPVWLDVDQCNMSEIPPLKESGKFTITAKPWIPNFNGSVIGMGGHLHGGGVDIGLTIGSTPDCASSARYGESKEYIFRGGKMENGEQVAEKHISSMSLCFYDQIKERVLSPAKPWVLTADYDYATFEGNKDEEGKQQSIMGIAIMFAEVPVGGVPAPKL